MDCINETMTWPVAVFWSLATLMTIYTKYDKSLTWFQALQMTGGFLRSKFTVKRSILHAAIVGLPMGLWLYLAKQCDPDMFSSLLSFSGS